MPTTEDLIVQNTVATNMLQVIGSGIDFPFRYVDGNSIGMVIQSNAGERIKDSITLILTIRPGERPFNPEFGSRLPFLVFEPNDNTLKDLLSVYTAQALERWEKRIVIKDITFIDDYQEQNTIGIRIEYTIRNSFVTGSFVFPFVLQGMETNDLYTNAQAGRDNAASAS